MKRLVGDPAFLGCVRALQLQRLQRSCHYTCAHVAASFMCTNMPAASTTQCQLEVGPQRVAQQQELSRVVSGIADTPVELSNRLREANDSWIAIKRRLKGGVFVRVEIDGGAR